VTLAEKAKNTSVAEGTSLSSRIQTLQIGAQNRPFHTSLSHTIGNTLILEITCKLPRMELLSFDSSMPYQQITMRLLVLCFSDPNKYKYSRQLSLITVVQE
jgi:hypothetical protein